MSNFVTDNTSLPAGKSDSRPVTGDPTKQIVAAEWNTVMQALYDVRTVLLPVLSATGGGFVAITDVNVPSGSASSKVFQDPPNNTILQSATISGTSIAVTIKASGPLVTVNGTSATLPLGSGGGYYTGTVNTTVAGSGNITAQVTTPDGGAGAIDTVALSLDAAPSILTLSITSGYPGAQTELKAGDTITISGTTDKPATGVQTYDFGAATAQTYSFASSTSFSITATVADRGTTPQALAAMLSAKNSAGAYGATRTTSNTMVLNNTYPSIAFGTVTYPASQTALKNSETATVVVTSSNLDTIAYTSPNGDLSITAPSVIGSPKTVTRIAGSYNASTNNLRAVATKASNGAVTTVNTVINIANVAPVITVSTPAARLRSGGNDGTAVQSHLITLLSDQNLASAPSLSEQAGGGTFTGSWAGSGTTWTRTLTVSDSQTKGTYTWQSLTATGLSGLVANTVTTGPTYVLGGFVPRTVTFGAFSATANINVAVVTYTKLQAGIFTATDQAALRNATQGDVSNIANTYTVTSLGANPTTVYWNDVSAVSSNSGGTAALTVLEEII